MATKSYDFPFLSRSYRSDFSCRDGEIALAEGCIPTDSDSLYTSDGADPDYISPYEGEEPPAPEVRFALSRTILPGWHVSTDNFPARTLNCPDPSIESWGKLAGDLLKQFTAEATGCSLFTSPFLIMAAWRLYDGRYVSPSSPVVLTPNSSAPVVAAAVSPGVVNQDLRIPAALCVPVWKISLPEQLRDWVGLILSLDILVSRQQQLYDPAAVPVYGTSVTTDSVCIALDPAIGKVTEQQVCTAMLPYAWKTVAASPSVADSAISSLSAFYTISSLPLASLSPMGEYGNVEFNCGNLATVYAGEPAVRNLSGSSAASRQEVTLVSTGEPLRITTRPFKLSGAGVLKSVSKVFVRGHFQPSGLTVSLYGSRDMRHWYLLSRRKGGAALYLNKGCGSRFYRLEIEGETSPGSTFEGLTII